MLKDDDGAAWIPDPVQRENLRRDLEWALEQDAKLAAVHFGTKRKVSYNPKAVLCSVCTKRIRLNNNGRLRVHLAGKAGSDKCMGSNSDPVAPQANFADVDNKPAEAKTVLPAAVQKDPLWQPPLFSDLA